MRYLIVLCSLACIASPSRAGAQSFTAKSVFLSGTAWDGSSGSMLGTREVRPLVLVNASPIPQPISFYAGVNGMDRLAELSPFGELWVRNSVSVGPGIGAASSERARIGQIQAIDGTGIVVGMTGTSTATGILVEMIGATGTEYAGMVLSSASNGTGTGLRIGGPQTSNRPTLAVGIDITGGTGLHYTALNLGSGTAIDIGGTLQPQLGVDCSVAGPNSIGVIARANTSGMGVVGISKSAAYVDPPLQPRVGVHGFSANNSNASADSVVGVLGTVMRGGVGGTQTRSVAVQGVATSYTTNHSGMMIGVQGLASAIGAGTSFGVGGLFKCEPFPQHLSLAAFGADIYLGGTFNQRPVAMQNAPAELRADNHTTTWMYNANISGNASLRGSLDMQSVFDLRPAAGAAVIVVPPTCVLALDAIDLPTVVGLAGGTRGRVLTVIVRRGLAIFVSNDLGSPNDMRFAFPDGDPIILRENCSAVFWYDIADTHWKLLSVVQ